MPIQSKLSSLIDEYIKNKASVKSDSSDKFKPNVWLSDAAKRAKQISMVTHALKFTHTDAKGTSIYVDRPKSLSENDMIYLSTSSILNSIIDVVGNAAALDVANLLQLKVDEVSLMDCILREDNSPLASFAEDEEQLLEWMSGFKKATEAKNLSSHTLAKQIYFPISKDVYHILSPLFATSLAHSLYQRIMDVRISETMKEARKAKRDKKYHEVQVIDYPNTAIQKFGGTKPQNVSLLNSKRGGKVILLNSQPPIWKSLTFPPYRYKDEFIRNYNRRAAQDLKSLIKYLKMNLNKDSNYTIRKVRSQYVDRLITIFLNYAVEVREMRPSGWSRNAKLSEAEQFFLDPERDDEEFREAIKSKEWFEEIAEKFAFWLNSRLRKAGLSVDDPEHKEWSKSLKKELVLLIKYLEA